MLSENLVEEAISLASYQIYALFSDPRFVWGPKLVSITVDGPGLDAPVQQWVGSVDQEWNENWGLKARFQELSLWKANTSRRYGKPTVELANLYPVLLMKGDYFYQGGIIDRSGFIGIGTSGIKGFADEQISHIVEAMIYAVAFASLEDVKAKGSSQL
jgi:hypothetical protein